MKQWKDDYGRKKRNKVSEEKCSDASLSPVEIIATNNSTSINMKPNPVRQCSCSQRGMKCSSMDRNHWKTPPFYDRDQFCYCQSASNNTYQCLRTVNEDQNYLFCRFTEEKLYEYYDYNKGDILNSWSVLSKIFQEKLIALLSKMVSCRGSVNCNLLHGNTFNYELHLQRRRRKESNNQYGPLKELMRETAKSSNNLKIPHDNKLINSISGYKEHLDQSSNNVKIYDFANPNGNNFETYEQIPFNQVHKSI